jgi:hypothetical protein
MKIADEYAYAESLANPAKRKVEHINAVNDSGLLSQITLAGELKPTTADNETTPETELEIMEQAFDDDGNLRQPSEVIKVSAEQPQVSPPPQAPRQATVPAFRDPQWEKTEMSYLKTAVENLNSLTRSYNLMAPDLAKKPYFSLERELKACFADVAPTVANALRDRALAPKIKGIQVVGHTPGGVLDKFAMDRASHVHDERKPLYGFKEFWRDLFATKK